MHAGDRHEVCCGSAVPVGCVRDSSAQDLEDLVPDISAAYRSCGDGSLVGVIVALLEGTPSLPPVVPAYVEKF